MRAVRVHNFGSVEMLRLEDVDLQPPGPEEARVKLSAIGVNFSDIYQRTGQYAVPLPFTPGGEGAGIVEAVGPAVTDVSVGDRVAFASATGAYAQAVNIPANALVPVPDSIDLTVAAAVMLQGMTAHYLSHDTYALQTGQTALVHAAAGGVGLLLVQMATQRGARVLGTVSNAEKADLARQAGAEVVLDYMTEDFVAGARSFSQGRGVDVVYDSVGYRTFDSSLDCLRPRGMLVLFGQSSGPVLPFNPQILNQKGSLFLTRPTLKDYIATRAELLRRSGDLFAWITAGTLAVRIDRTYPLDEVAAAQTALASRETKGKVLLIP